MYLSIAIIFNLVASDALYFNIYFYEIIQSNALQHNTCRLDSDDFRQLKLLWIWIFANKTSCNQWYNVLQKFLKLPKILIVRINNICLVTGLRLFIWENILRLLQDQIENRLYKFLEWQPCHYSAKMLAFNGERTQACQWSHSIKHSIRYFYTLVNLYSGTPRNVIIACLNY